MCSINKFLKRFFDVVICSIALIVLIPVWLVVVPHLAAKILTAITADQPGGQHAVSAVLATYGFAPSHLILHQIPLAGVDDGWVAILHIVLGCFTFVRFHFLG